MKEAQIIKGCLEGRKEAQKALVMSYSGYLMTVARRYMPDNESAKDALQDGYLKIFKNFHQFSQKKGALKSWMSRIVANEALNKRRKFIDSYAVNDQEAIIVEVAPKAIDQLHEEDLLKVINGIPEPYRLVFNLYILEGYKHKEIAELLNIKESTSRANLTRAKTLLRKRIIELEPNARWNTVK